MANQSTKTPVNVGLFATCLVDLFRPTVGFAAAQLIENTGCTVHVPEQTCCGQPAYNSGDSRHARQIARAVIEIFEDYDYVVVPSGSCGGMIAVHYPALLADVGFHVFNASFDGFSKGSFERIRRGADYDRTMENILRAAEIARSAVAYTTDRKSVV